MARSFAQAGGADCTIGTRVCTENTGPAMLFTANDEVGLMDFLDGETSGCLDDFSAASNNLEFHQRWFVFTAAQSGQLGFNIGYQSLNEDWDFAVYGPNASCGNLGDPVRCNSEAENNGYTGVGINPLTGDKSLEYDDWLDVQAGEEYIVFITNHTAFPSDPAQFTFEFSGPLVDDFNNEAVDCTPINQFLGSDINECTGNVVSLDATRSAPATYQWFVNGNTIAAANGGNDAILNVTVSGTYSVEIISEGQLFTDEVSVTFFDPLQLSDISYEVDDMMNQNNIRISVTGNSAYEFSLNSGPFQATGNFPDVSPGVHSVEIRDLNGCEPVFLEIPVVGYPKFFTPNGDTINDTWHITPLENLEIASVDIYDRYGKLIRQLHVNSSGWDGTYQGLPLPADDYWFSLRYSRQMEDGSTKTGELKRHFCLKR